MTIPTNCHLWSKDKLTNEDINVDRNFEHLQTFVNDSHFWRYLLKCKDCGQLYFFEFNEEIDWKKGNDAQYVTLIPISSKEEAKKLADMDQFEILKFQPRIQSDWPSDKKKKKVHWIGK